MPIISKQDYYLPLSFINGFASPSSIFWVYDKKSDAIISSPKPPNHIFYEWNKNNIVRNKQENDISATAAYQYVDDIVVNCFEEIQNETVFGDDIIGWEEEGMIENVLEIKISEGSKHKIISGISAFLNVATTEKKTTTQQHCKIIQSRHASFVLSDNPILYKQSSDDYNDSSNSIVFPLTEKRVYYEPKNSHHVFDSHITQYINILLALQAKEYFASTDLTFLQEVVVAYKIMKPFEHNVDDIKADLFQMINT